MPIEVSSSVWIECHTLDGHKFFHDLFTRTSCWELPSPPPPVASIPLPSGPPPLKQVRRAGGGVADKTTPIPAQGSLADRAPVDFESALRDKRAEYERLKRCAACPVCTSKSPDFVCGGCNYCPQHCQGFKNKNQTCDSDSALQKKMWARERLEIAACPVCTRRSPDTVCGGCNYCPDHCLGLTHCDSEIVLQEKMWARERQVIAACPVCTSGLPGTVCSACNYCPRHCERLTVCD